MNTYGYSAFVDDYVFLEEIGRKVVDWGRGIQEMKLLGDALGSTKSSKAREKGSDKMRMRRGVATRPSKREVLRDILLQRADIDMQLCPEGMERRKVNQSTWDKKYVTPLHSIRLMVTHGDPVLSCRTNTGYLTIQYRFHPANNLIPSNHDRQSGSNTKRKKTLDAGTRGIIHLLTHRNDIITPIRDLLCRLVGDQSKKGTGLPAWIKEMINGGEVRNPLSIKEEESTRPTSDEYAVLIRSPAASLGKGIRASYERLDTEVTLMEALRGQSFAEFPTFEVVREREWTEVNRWWGTNTEHEQEDDESDEEEDEEVQERRYKRRKVDEEAGKKLLGGLAAYGEEEDEEGNTSGSDLRAGLEKKTAGLLEMLDYSSGSSEASELEDANVVASVYPARATALDLGCLGGIDEADWEDE